MTKEDLIRNLEYTMEKHKNDRVNTFGTDISAMCRDVLDYLEQEPCEDCISRQLIYEIGATCIATRNENGKLIALGAIEELPSVKLKEPNKNEVILSNQEYRELLSNEYDNGYDKGFREALEQLEQDDVLEKIKAEIEQEFNDDGAMQEYTVDRCLDIIDKYRKEE